MKASNDWSYDVITRAGINMHMRPVRPQDEPALAEFFHHVSPEDLRFRFLAGVRELSHDRLAAMTNVDHQRSENFLAFAEDGETIIATAMLACDDALERGEVAISVRADFKHKGVAWSDCEPDYLRWIVRQPDMDEDKKFTAKHWLEKR